MTGPAEQNHLSHTCREQDRALTPFVLLPRGGERVFPGKSPHPRCCCGVFLPPGILLPFLGLKLPLLAWLAGPPSGWIHVFSPHTCCPKLRRTPTCQSICTVLLLPPFPCGKLQQPLHGPTGLSPNRQEQLWDNPTCLRSLINSTLPFWELDF